MLTLLISALLSFGMIDSIEDFQSLSINDQNTLLEIIIEDNIDF